jgi:hypothetical protein
MPGLIHGRALIPALGASHLEFLKDYVAKGLCPHNEFGLKFTPADVIIFMIAGLEKTLSTLEDNAWNLTGIDREETIAFRIQPLQQELENRRAYLQSIQGLSWIEFALPEDGDLAAQFLRTLENSYFEKDKADEFLSAETKSTQSEFAEDGYIKPKRERHDQICKRKCRELAKRVWTKNPKLTITEITKRDEIIDISKTAKGDLYAEKTVHDWIKDLCPNRAPGRRPTKKRQS